MRRAGRIGLLLVLLAGAVRGAQDPGPLERDFASPPDDSRIMMRWWWFGPSATKEQIDAELRAMKEGGIGGVELAVVYPMALDDPARGIRNYPYLSREFLDAFRFAAQRTRELGMRLDVTLGSGWSFGGTHITPELAAARLRSHRFEIAPDVKRVARPVPHDHERLLAGFVGRGAVRGEVDPNSFQPLDLTGGGPVPIPAGEGPRTILFYFASRTGQVVKRAAIGAEGYVLDHYNRAAIDTHLREVGDTLVDAAGPGVIHAIFCDSLEVYEADWTADMPAEFEKRRGYPLLPRLPLIDYNGDGADVLRRDLGRTQTELFEERFMQPLRDWSRRRNVRLRIQGYGVPPAALASHRHADILDGEGFEWRTLSRARWAASAAHLLGRKVVSSETWTWIHSPSFRATPLDMKAEADLHFLSGVNQLIGHGWPSSPPQAGSPGWPFYAAGAFTDKNPWWPVMKDLSAYLHRVSHVLRQGDPVADIGIYAPTGDARAAMRPGTAEYLNLHIAIRNHIGPAIVESILQAGYSFDLLDDETLKEAEARGYKAIVLPGVRWMPEPTRQWLQRYVRAGGTLVAARRTPEGDWPGLTAVPDTAIVGEIARAAAPDLTLGASTAIAESDHGIGFVHRRLPDADIYFLANTSNESRQYLAQFRSRTPHVEVWDPHTGKTEAGKEVSVGAMALPLSFEPYASRIVVFRKQPGSARADDGRSPHLVEELAGGWTVAVGAVRRAGVTLPHSWADEGPTRYFSGAGTYERTFQVPEGIRRTGSLFLEFGRAGAVAREPLPDGTMRGNSFAALVAPPVREAATVFVNGRRAGSVWAPPYRVEVTPLVRDGSNDLRIDVYNTAINQLAEGGRVPDVKALVERYGQRFRLQDMDRFVPLPSGILAVPQLVVER